ncbi:hypothetical protein BDW67DRAFT_178859 [Aspergillus spinulosporus]
MSAGDLLHSIPDSLGGLYYSWQTAQHEISGKLCQWLICNGPTSQISYVLHLLSFVIPPLRQQPARSFPPQCLYDANHATRASKVGESKNCQYAYPPVSLSGSEPHSESDNGPTAPVTGNDSFTVLPDTSGSPDLDFLETGVIPDFFDQIQQFQYPPLRRRSTSTWTLPNTSPSLSSLTRFLGTLGEVLPIQGSSQTWQWLIDELKSYPPQFAKQGETIFIHRELYRGPMPKSIRMAFGISCSSCLLSDANRNTLFKAIDTEVEELLNTAEPATLLDDLAMLQALLLYQTIRFFHGTFEQRSTAEQQQSLLMARALRLVSRSQNELTDEAADRHAWVIAECIRRTAIVVYMLYGVNSMSREGICVGLHTLAKLPVSTAVAFWNATETAGGDGSVDGTISYEDFLACWLVSTPRRLDPFERLLIVPCRGVDAVEAFDSLALFESRNLAIA